MSGIEPLNVWIEKRAEDLYLDIASHIEEIAEDLSTEDTNTLLRFTMMSVRQWDRQNKVNLDKALASLKEANILIKEAGDHHQGFHSIIGQKIRAYLSRSGGNL